MSDTISLKEKDAFGEKLLQQVEDIFGTLTTDQSNFIHDLVCDVLSEVNQGQKFRAFADLPSPPEPRAVRLARAWSFDALRLEIEGLSQINRMLQVLDANGGVAVPDSPTVSGTDQVEGVEELKSRPEPLASINLPSSSLSNDSITEQITSTAIGSQSTTATSPVVPEGSLDGKSSSAAAASVAATSIPAGGIFDPPSMFANRSSSAQNQSPINDTDIDQMVKEVEASAPTLNSPTSEPQREPKELFPDRQNETRLKHPYLL